MDYVFILVSATADIATVILAVVELLDRYRLMRNAKKEKKTD